MSGYKQNDSIPHPSTPRQVDPQVFLPALLELVDQGQEVSLVISGGSMTPFLVHGRDTILISPVRRPLRRGDMALYRRTNGYYVMHRICRVQMVDGQPHYYFVGDAQTQIEGPILREQILGHITAVKRKGRWLRRGDFWWEFFAHVWLWLRPARPVLRRAYGLCFGWKNQQKN